MDSSAAVLPVHSYLSMYEAVCEKNEHCANK
jgi:hypothetical protein